MEMGDSSAGVGGAGGCWGEEPRDVLGGGDGFEGGGVKEVAVGGGDVHRLDRQDVLPGDEVTLHVGEREILGDDGLGVGVRGGGGGVESQSGRVVDGAD